MAIFELEYTLYFSTHFLPMYEFHLDHATGEADLDYYVLINQNTGFEWDQVRWNFESLNVRLKKSDSRNIIFSSC